MLLLLVLQFVLIPLHELEADKNKIIKIDFIDKAQVGMKLNLTRTGIQYELKLVVLKAHHYLHEV